MNLFSPEPLVIFSNTDWNTVYNLPRYQQWYSLAKILNGGEFRVIIEEELSGHYDDHLSSFLDLQLKFFLLRNSTSGNYTLFDLFGYWQSNLPRTISCRMEVVLMSATLLNFQTRREFGLFHYHPEKLLKYIIGWKDAKTDLKTWEQFQFIQVPGDVEGFVRFASKHEQFILSSDLLVRLYAEEVGRIFDLKFKPRFKQKKHAENEKQLIKRLLSLTGTKEDLQYLNRNFLKTPYENQIVEKLLRCEQGNIAKAEYDIHSPDSMKMYSALLKYYNVLNNKNSGNKASNPRMYFRKISTKSENYQEAFQYLQFLFDELQSYCPNTSWGDFKSILSKNGSKVRVNWTGDVSVLNYVLRRIGRNIVYEGGSKWEVVSYYFYDEGLNKGALTPERLPGNSHVKRGDMPNLDKKLDLLISALTR